MMHANHYVGLVGLALACEVLRAGEAWRSKLLWWLLQSCRLACQLVEKLPMVLSACYAPTPMNFKQNTNNTCSASCS